MINATLGELGWISDSSSDHDEDGCRDRTEDSDDDNDGLTDRADGCRFSPLGFNHQTPDDTDRDGCRDRDEDDDLAGVSLLKAIPASQSILLRWINPAVPLSNTSILWLRQQTPVGSKVKTDHLHPQSIAEIRIGELESGTNYTFTLIPHYANGGSGNQANISVQSGPNYDNDTQADSLDKDDDNDGVADLKDACRTGELHWQSSDNNDYDGDGCRDEGEDMDDDNDNIVDNLDKCRLGEFGWISNSSSDHDEDGCRDKTEDADDDNDGLTDRVDGCRFSPLGFNYRTPDDTDRDGCRDRDEDQSLVGIAFLTAIPTAESVLLRWKNPNVPLSHINIFWSQDAILIGNRSKKDQLHPRITAISLVEDLVSQLNYTFTVIPHYANGGVGKSDKHHSADGT